MTDLFFYYSLLFLLIFSLIAVYNFFTAPQLRKTNNKIEKPGLVSILIPARNEENNITDCVKSVLKQDYENTEIFILDDNSTDRTASIVAELSNKNQNVKFISGKELPEGWLGKNWACHQLSQNAKGKYLVFVDADVRLNENAITASIDKMKGKSLKALSVFPTQIIKTFGEALITPLMNWILLSFLPLNLVYKSQNKSFVAANGQFFLFEAEFYKKLGGHEAVKNETVEDMAFARLIKQSGEKFLTCLGNEFIRCRMYSNFSEGFAGFSKNFFPGFKLSPLIFILFLLFIESVFLFPILLSLFYSKFIIQSLIILSTQILVLQTSRQNVIFSLLHPLQIIVLFAVGVNSTIKTKLGKLKWKERIIK